MEMNKKQYANRFRLKRFQKLIMLIKDVISEKGACRIADVGGKMDSWEAFREFWADLPIKVTLMNLHTDPVTDPRFESVIADARDLSAYSDNSFDLVFSNSVIEHAGVWADQQRLAAEIKRIAPRHFVQTPNFWFPLEPHFRLPFIHWLPTSWRMAIVRTHACGFYPRATSREMAEEIVSDARLLDAKQMAMLFPQSAIRRERVLFTKSLIAIR